jgi:hypothetical protein
MKKAAPRTTKTSPSCANESAVILRADNYDVEVEYALRPEANPIGVAAYRLQSKLLGEIKGKLPTAKQIAELVRVEMEAGK